MNDKALYQLERAIEALSEMVKYMREDQIVFDKDVTVSGNGFYGDNTHSEYWYDYDRNNLNQSNPFRVGGNSSSDVITF
jgi:hypothetical protein